MRKNWVATLDGSGQEVSVALEREGTEFRLRVGETSLRVDAAVVGKNRWSLIIDGRSVVVDISREEGRLTVVGAEGVSSLILEDAQRKALADSVSAGREQIGEVIVAPIAGKVVRFFVAVGDEVVAGQPVVALEAMKMENEIKASVDGVVKGIHVDVGASVETRSKLLTIE